MLRIWWKAQLMFCFLVCVVTTSFQGAAWELVYSRKAIPIEVGESICGLSKKLKDVAPWTQQKISALTKTRDEYESKILDWKLHFHESPGCGENESIIDGIHTALETVNKELEKLSRKAIRAGALAAKSAGRVDEFITVFANAKDGTGLNETSKYCLGSGGHPAKRRDLYECFTNGGQFEMDEANLAKIPESVNDKGELHLASAIENINHSNAVDHFLIRKVLDSNANCNLINGKSGILGGALQYRLWWGGGILTIGKEFDGILSSKLEAGETSSGASDRDKDKAFWTASPHTIPHLQKTLAAFQDFKNCATLISQKFSEIEKIEKQIEPCLSNETTEESPTQSCFQNAVKLNAELQAANALLARYHKEKGPLPSGSHRTHARCAMHFLYLIAFLL